MIRRAIPVVRVRKLVVGVIVFIDTILLWIRAIGRRVKTVGPTRLFAKARVPSGRLVLYFDLGTHKDANELSWMIDKVLPHLGGDFRAYGFEAAPNFLNHVRERLGDRANVELVNAALCFTVPEGGTIRLYTAPGAGLATSVYREGFGEYSDVPALQFSQWVRSRNLDLGSSICLLRMNIEGSEYDVISDLVESGLAKHIDGFFGMWDDVSKIDQRRSDKFRAFLRQNDIHPFTFNGRDFTSGFRMRCIEYDIDTAVQIGVAKCAASRVG